MNQGKIAEILINHGLNLLKKPRRDIEAPGISEADKLAGNIEQFPHAFVLVCVMDKQFHTEKIWPIPYMISKEIGGFELNKLLNSEEIITDIFNREKPVKYYNKAAKEFYSAIQTIHGKYNDDASNIWKNNPSSATVVRRFLQFDGIGIKIATMAANILVREFKVPMKDMTSIDISPDIHVRRVFKRIGLTSDINDIQDVIYCARELYPEYPGVLDIPTWEIGRNYCKKENPKCQDCTLNDYCPKIT